MRRRTYHAYGATRGMKAGRVRGGRAGFAKYPGSLTEAQVQEIARLYEETKLPMHYIAWLFNVSDSWAKKQIRELGVVTRSSRRGSVDAIREDEKRVVDYYVSSGATIRETAEHFGGRDPLSVLRVLDGAGVQLREPREVPVLSWPNPAFDAPIGLLAAASVATLAFGIWGWAKRAR
jgi:hypothetical protein